MNSSRVQIPSPREQVLAPLERKGQAGMNLRFALLADYAAVIEGGKLLVAGEFDRVVAPSLPATAPPFYLVARFDAQVSEGTEHRLRIHLVDADGHEVAPPAAEVPFPFGALGPGRPLRGQVIVQINGAKFPKYGAYEFHLNVDGRNEGVVQIPVAPAPAADEQA